MLVQGLEYVGEQCPELVGVLGQRADAAVGGDDPAGDLVGRLQRAVVIGGLRLRQGRTAHVAGERSGGCYGVGAMTMGASVRLQGLMGEWVCAVGRHGQV
ncbi:hypothetical protein [Streptomyces sp. RM99]|uniref:hypothetical protein n=1 Tax=Streptomyces sp. RM99 TaxID=2824897 RepID=UPI001B35A905|nr:hypothetical protein [Streptomyces sp. RM99]MBQ0916372.1 hypothetical protein [Streptomyces sp. RM99]